MSAIDWWRLWVSSGVLTCAAAFTCIVVIVRALRSELRRAMVQIKTHYHVADNRLALLSERMDGVEQQILKILLHLLPESRE